MDHKYKIISDAREEIANDMVAKGMKPRAAYDKYCKLTEKRPTLQSFYVMISRWGITVASAEVRKVDTRSAVKRGKQRARDEVKATVKKIAKDMALRQVKTRDIVSRMAERIIMNKTAAAKVHEGRMMRHLNRVEGAMKSIPIYGSTESVAPYLACAEKFDGLSRRLFGMDKGSILTANQLSIAVLINSDQVQIDPSRQSTELEADCDLEDL